MVALHQAVVHGVTHTPTDDLLRWIHMVAQNALHLAAVHMIARNPLHRAVRVVARNPKEDLLR